MVDSDGQPSKSRLVFTGAQPGHITTLIKIARHTSCVVDVAANGSAEEYR